MQARTQLGGGFLRQICRVAICRQVVEGLLSMGHGRSLGHGRLVGHVWWCLDHRVWWQLVRHMAMLHRGLVVVRRQGVVGCVGPLSHHVVSTTAIRGLIHRSPYGRPSLVTGVVHVLCSKLRAALLRCHVVAVRRPWRWCRGWHAIARHKRLRLRVEGVSVEAARDRVLALRVVGISVDRKRTEGIRYAVV